MIVKPLAQVAGITRKLTSDESSKVMNKLYYPEVNELKDKHYVELFWNKVYYFWVFFEHTVIAFITVLVISFAKITHLLSVTGSLKNLWLWVILLLSLIFLFLLHPLNPELKAKSDKYLMIR